MPPTTPVVRRLAPFSSSVRHLPHLAFLLVVIGTLARLVELNNALCWSVAPPTVLLAAVYVGGLARWDRLSTSVRPLWLGLLLVLWFWICWILPAFLASGYVWLAVPLAVVALRMPGRRVVVTAVGAITVLLVVALVRIGGGFDLEVLAPPIAAVWTVVALYRAQQRLLRELADTRGELASRQREAGRLAERARIARDLHDTLAQELSGSRMLLQAADRDWDRRPDAARTRVRAVVDALGANLAETRSIIGDLTPPALERNDLETALRELCARTQQTAAGAPRISFRTDGEPRAVPADRAAALLRVAQGLLANACEHAHAAHVQVALHYADDGTVTVEVGDDGTGFDATATGAPRDSRGFGLAAGRDRLDAYGGTLTFDTAPGHGTRARAALPVSAPVMAGAS